MNWRVVISEWKREFNCEFLPALPIEIVHQKLDSFRNIPHEFRAFYTACNGLSCESFSVFPLHDVSNVKKTWKSLERMNDVRTSEFFRKTAEPERSALFERFFVFAEVGYEECGVLDRLSGKIWYQNQSKLNQLTTDLPEFLELAIRDASE